MSDGSQTTAPRQHKIGLDESEMPTRWYNIIPDLPAPPPPLHTHALAACVREALACRETGEEKVILTALCGHGHFDMAAYASYLDGAMIDDELTDARLRAALETVPAV